MKGLRLAIRVFIALAGLLSVAILTTSATLLYNSGTALRDEAEIAAVHLAELISGTFAEMGEISLANVARTLDSTLDEPMTAQARIVAHMVDAAEAAGYDPPRIIEILEAIVRDTVLDEFWITDDQGFSYLTNVRDETGALVPFQFDPDPAVQPQASKFYTLLMAPLDGDDFITQPAQVREINQQVFKYVGVGGVDQPRIVQVGDALVFGDQELLRNVYASQRPDVSAVIEGILGQHMTVQTTILDYFISTAEAAEWTTEEIDLRLRRIVDTTTIGEIRIVDSRRGTIYSNFPPGGGGPVSGRHAAFRGPRRPAGRVGAGGRAPDIAARLRRHRLQVRHKGQPGLVAPDPGRRAHRKQCGQPALLGLPAAGRHPGPFPKPPGALDRQS